ncbi:hypothetical protein HW132_35175 [Brasilonema sp. CT11]|nr:hypothetical protein [Brasilonema sp. CT11]
MRKKEKGEQDEESGSVSDESDSAAEGDKLLSKKVAPLHVGAESKRD